MDNYVLVENNQYESFNDIKSVFKSLLGEDYYSLNKLDKRKRIYERALLNSINNKELLSVITNIKDEYLYLLYLLKYINISLLEKKEIGGFSKHLSKYMVTDNYIIINDYVEELLMYYMGDGNIEEKIC